MRSWDENTFPGTVLLCLFLVLLGILGNFGYDLCGIKPVAQIESLPSAAEKTVDANSIASSGHRESGMISEASLHMLLEKVWGVPKLESASLVESAFLQTIEEPLKTYPFSFHLEYVLPRLHLCPANGKILARAAMTSFYSVLLSTDSQNAHKAVWYVRILSHLRCFLINLFANPELLTIEEQMELALLYRNIYMQASVTAKLGKAFPNLCPKGLLKSLAVRALHSPAKIDLLALAKETELDLGKVIDEEFAFGRGERQLSMKESIIICFRNRKLIEELNCRNHLGFFINEFKFGMITVDSGDKQFEELVSTAEGWKTMVAAVYAAATLSKDSFKLKSYMEIVGKAVAKHHFSKMHADLTDFLFEGCVNNRKDLIVALSYIGMDKHLPHFMDDACLPSLQSGARDLLEEIVAALYGLKLEDMETGINLDNPDSGNSVSDRFDVGDVWRSFRLSKLIAMHGHKVPHVRELVLLAVAEAKSLLPSIIEDMALIQEILRLGFLSELVAKAMELSKANSGEIETRLISWMADPKLRPFVVEVLDAFQGSFAQLLGPLKVSQKRMRLSFVTVTTLHYFLQALKMLPWEISVDGLLSVKCSDLESVSLRALIGSRTSSTNVESGMPKVSYTAQHVFPHLVLSASLLEANGLSRTMDSKYGLKYFALYELVYRTELGSHSEIFEQLPKSIRRLWDS